LSKQTATESLFSCVGYKSSSAVASFKKSSAQGLGRVNTDSSDAVPLKGSRQCRPSRPQSTLDRRFLISIDLISSFVVGISGGEILSARKPISSSVGITLGIETRLKRGYSTSASSRCLSSTSPAADDYGDGHHMFPSLLDDG